MKKILLFFTIATDGWMAPVIGQDSNTDNHALRVKIPEVALVDIEPSGANSIELSADAPTEAGNPLTFTATNNDLWLNYSSIVPDVATKRRKITVQLDETVPGIDVKLAVGAYTGAGLGNKGTGVAGPTTLSTTAQDAVTGIGSSYTENGANKGHRLTYTFDVATGNYGDIFALDHDVVVTYTITAAQ